ncbi:uroporphyrinogen-III synthase [Bosea psychrotolerans]|uniref:Uroporphyrinogen-III synthase n=1 Tax=Bosea psychrotolerans TaxID=1871628 RepID=A0A2S4LWK5_9HYPH|nr:uroporphyrinogen-III synthase [Bosea psychrotolerans]POR46831.1 uroporphyrinogen-III synthase [Bosea psychrotolerans]
MRILVLRPQADAERSARAVAARGCEPLIAPLFTIVRLPEPAPARDFAALVLTSSNAVGALAEAPLAWRDLPVFSVGARTAGKAREAGYADARSADGNRHDLIDLINRNLPPPSRLLLIAGRDSHEDVPQRLRDAGYDVTIWTAYAAEAVSALPANAAKALRDGKVDAALHYSPRGARTFLTLAREAGLAEPALALTHVALSADVAAPLITAGASTVLVAEHPEEAGLLAALDQVSARNRLRDDVRDEPAATTGVETETGPMNEPDAEAMKRGRARRTPPTIDLTAQDTSTAQDAAPSATGTASASAAPPEAVLPTEALPQEFAAPEAKPAAAHAGPDSEESRHADTAQPSHLQQTRSHLPWPALALAGIVGGMVGGMVGAGLAMLAWSRMTPAVDIAQIAELRARIDSLQGAATALDRKAEAAVKAGTEAQAAAARLVEQAKAQGTQNADAGAIASLSAQAQRAEAAANALGQRLATVETLAKTASAPSPQALAAARIVLAERIQSAIASGQPFAGDVAALAKGGGAPEQIAALNAVATTGAPTRDALLTRFRGQRAMFAREMMPATANWQDRLLGLASRIVTIRPVGDTGSNDPATLLIRLENALASGNFVVAAGLWSQLPEPARRASTDFGAALQKRAAADAAIAKIAQDAVTDLGAAG